MKTFIDSTGREWALKLTLGTAKRVMDKTGVNLLDPAQITFSLTDSPTDAVSSRLVTDLNLVGTVCAALIEKQAKEKGVDDADEIFDGATLASAQTAFLQEYKHFFSEAKNGPAENLADAMLDAVETARKGVLEPFDGATSIDSPEESAPQTSNG